MKKVLSVLLVAVLVFGLVACGDGGTSSLASSASAGQPAIVPPSSEVSSTSIPDPVVLNQAFLTGLEKGDDYPEGKRVTAVMVNNIAQSRPTRGLSECQVLVEIKAEGGITRFMPIYEDYEKIPEVGGLRSARDQFFQLLLPFWGFYVHEGQSTPMNQYLKDWDYLGASDAKQRLDLANGAFSLAWRDQNRLAQGYSLEYTMYTSGEKITESIQNNELDDYRSYGSPMFNFVPYTDPTRTPEEGSSSEVKVTHSTSYISHFTYDGDMYKMAQYNSSKGVWQDTVDENNGDHVQFKNIIVIFAPMTLYAASPLVKVDYIGGGGFYFTEGGWERLIWEKGGPNQALQLYKFDGSGEPIMVNPGTSYLAVVDDKEAETFYADLTAGKMTQSGGVISNEVETED